MTSAQTRDLTYGSGQLLKDPNLRAATVARHCELPLQDIADLNDLPSELHRTLALIAGLESVRAAREFTTSTLRRWKAAAAVEDAVLVASELVTNAIRHGTPASATSAGIQGLELAWQRQADRIICVVTDCNCDPPVLQDADTESESGRGLHVVDELAAAWGAIMLGAQGKAVWATLCCLEGCRSGVLR